MPVGHEDHRGVPVAPAVSPGGARQPLNLGFGEVLASTELRVGEPPGPDCSFYGGRHNQLEMRLRHMVHTPRVDDRSYNSPFANSHLRRVAQR